MAQMTPARKQRRDLAWREYVRQLADRYWLAQLKRWPLSRVYGKPTGIKCRRLK